MSGATVIPDGLPNAPTTARSAAVHCCRLSTLKAEPRLGYRVRAGINRTQTDLD